MDLPLFLELRKLFQPDPFVFQSETSFRVQQSLVLSIEAEIKNLLFAADVKNILHHGFMMRNDAIAQRIVVITRKMELTSAKEVKSVSNAVVNPAQS